MSKRQLIERYSSFPSKCSPSSSQEVPELLEPMTKIPKITKKGFHFLRLMNMPEMMLNVINKLDFKDYISLRESSALMDSFCHQSRKSLGIQYPGTMTITPRMADNGVPVCVFLNILGFTAKDALERTSGISFRYVEFIDPQNTLSEAPDEVKTELLEVIKGRKWRTVGLSMLNIIPSIVDFIKPTELCNVSRSNVPMEFLKCDAYPTLTSYGIYSPEWTEAAGRFRQFINLWKDKLIPSRIHICSGVIFEESVGHSLEFPDENWLSLRFELMLANYMNFCYGGGHEFNYPHTEIIAKGVFNNERMTAHIRTKITRDDEEEAWIVVYFKPYEYKNHIRYQSYAHFYAGMRYIRDPPVYLPLPL